MGSVANLDTQKDIIHAVAKAKDIYQPKNFPIENIWSEFEKYLRRKSCSVDATKRYKYRVTEFLNWIKNNCLDISTLADITDDISKKYADFLLDAGKAAKTYNEDLNTLFLVFETLKEESGIINNPFRKDKISRRIKEPISRQEFSKEQTLTILNSFLELKDVPFINEYEVLFYLGVFAGFRLKDAALLTWTDINTSQNLISITPYKTKKHNIKVYIPIHPWLKSKLNEASDWKTDKYVLPNIAEEYNIRRDRVGGNARKILKNCGFSTDDILDKKEYSQRKLKPCLYGFHSFRYSFVSFCAEAGIPMALVQDIVGHMNPAMTKHYTRFSNEFKQKAINSLSINAPEEPDLKDRIKSLIDSADDFKLDKIYKFIQKLL